MEGFWRVVFAVDCVWEGFAEGFVGEDSCEGFWGGFFVRGFSLKGFFLKGFFVRGFFVRGFFLKGFS